LNIDHAPFDADFQKEEVYQHIWKLYLPYTIIDVGYWHQLSFPTVPSGRVDYASLFKPKVEIHDGGSMPTMLADLRDIGRFVALIIKDERTLNKFVAAYGDVLSENEIFEIMETLSGEKIERKYVSLTVVGSLFSSHRAALYIYIGICGRDGCCTRRTCCHLRSGPEPRSCSHAIHG
jgi:hypothetical protein